ncbi:MAG: hypothetical protein PHQ33_08345 [Bacteroidales bacterium]|nr:hypothetical protein [Bacteroidales bacterium]
MKKLGLLFLSLVLLSACKKEEKFSDIPAIEFVSLTKIDNGTNVDQRATLVLHFQDGGGDIGLNSTDISAPYDTSSVYYYNFFIDYYKKVNGEFQLIEFEEISFNQRIPRLSETLPESIEGDITLELDINSYDLSTTYDTIRFDCYIVDRALHHSNTITTPELVVKKK